MGTASRTASQHLRKPKVLSGELGWYNSFRGAIIFRSFLRLVWGRWVGGPSLCQYELVDCGKRAYLPLWRGVGTRSVDDAGLTHGSPQDGAFVLRPRDAVAARCPLGCSSASRPGCGGPAGVHRAARQT